MQTAAAHPDAFFDSNTQARCWQTGEILPSDWTGISKGTSCLLYIGREGSERTFTALKAQTMPEAQTEVIERGLAAPAGQAKAAMPRYVTRYIEACMKFDTQDVATCANLRQIVIPILERYRRDLLSGLAITRNHTHALPRDVRRSVLFLVSQSRLAVRTARARLNCQALSAPA